MANFFQSDLVVTDPDQLSFAKTGVSISSIFGAATDELLIDYSNKRIALKVTGNLGDDGATIKAVYSKLKDAWSADADLIKFPFPMGPITDESFEMINGWNWDNTEVSGTVSATTVELLRTGGWSVVDAGGTVQEEWAGVVTLGTLGTTDQVYYNQVDDETVDNTAIFKLFGQVNQAIQIFDNGVFNYRGFLQLFVREWQKGYAASNFGDIGIVTATFQAYRFPLTNATDLKVTHAEELLSPSGLSITATSGDGTNQTYTTGTTSHGLSAGDIVTIAGSAPTAGYDAVSASITAVTATTFSIAGAEIGASSTAAVTADIYNNVDITYVRDTNGARVRNSNIRGAWATTTTYSVGDVVQDIGNSTSQVDGLDHWFILDATTGDSTGASLNADTNNTWSVYAGERNIAGAFYPFTVLVDGDNTSGAIDTGSAPRTDEIYEKVQYSLRLSSDIDSDGVGAVIGKTADALLTFVGDTLVTSQGVYIDTFNSSDTNAIEFVESGGSTQVFNFVSTITINFGTNLQDDEFSKYFVFFTNDAAADTPSGNNFGTINAIQVQDNNGDIIGSNAQSGEVNSLVNPSWPTKRSDVTHTYNYDGNIQRGAGSSSKDAPITVVGIGLNTGQYVSATGTIGRSKANSVSLVAALERNYDTGTV